jgi:hypothetical protein
MDQRGVAISPLCRWRNFLPYTWRYVNMYRGGFGSSTGKVNIIPSIAVSHTF